MIINRCGFAIYFFTKYRMKGGDIYVKNNIILYDSINNVVFDIKCCLNFSSIQELDC